ncbi:hypothetical protein LIPSTDRAFT_5732 [Lipomyces starkeyi NRRL Y-11557]|uniref:Uncharacterized protein n=1 Tax=Lipomyces starkeyi NRRL Y-11557 TaxID=675824 RepID=A0A1E3PZX4_LIPST|nr:hypothetical protein LIPSTDRAFT_5732 [Lipomyces starkeyi NRRL Y-11557]
MKCCWQRRRPRQTEIFNTADVINVKLVEHQWRVPLHVNSIALQGLLFGLGSMFVVWTFTIGVSPPFSDGTVVLNESQALQEAVNNGRKYFIAANLWNNEAILDQWGKELIRAIEILGSENVYISIVENDSEDRTPEKLGAVRILR